MQLLRLSPIITPDHSFLRKLPSPSNKTMVNVYVQLTREEIIIVCESGEHFVAGTRNMVVFKIIKMRRSSESVFFFNNYIEFMSATDVS